MSAAIRLVVDVRERDLIAALHEALPYFIQAQRQEKLDVRIQEVRLEEGSVVFVRQDGSVERVVKRETLETLEALLGDDCAELALALGARWASATTTSTQSSSFIATPPVTFHVRQLDSGDVVYERPDQSSAAIMERKAANDLAASIADGRMHSQSLRMLSIAAEESSLVEYLFEVPMSKRRFLDPTYTGPAFPGTRMPAAALRGAVHNCVIRDGCIASYPQNIQETALHLLDRLTRVQRFDPLVGTERHKTRTRQHEQLAISTGGHKRRRQENATPQTRFADMLQASAHVGADKALAVAQHFGSMVALVTLMPSPQRDDGTPKERRELLRELRPLFSDVNGIGDETALSLWAALQSAEAPAKPVPAASTTPSATTTSSSTANVSSV